MSENIWDSVLSAVEKRLNHESFKAFFRPTSFHSLDGSTLKVNIPDRILENLIRNNYSDLLKESFEEAGIPDCIIVFEYPPESMPQPDEARTTIKLDSKKAPSRQYFSTASAHPPQPAGVKVSGDDLNESQLDSKYTFDTFVVGKSNVFAHNAAMAVADEPSKAYNPLFIYGGVGLGKTHLMCAIGHRIKEKYPHLRLCYISAERFLNEMTTAIRWNQTIDFRKRYRLTDVLLIDDIQFIQDKKGTQEEFFHTFNELHQAQKQIVISADCAPKDIPTLEERLHSRFEWGLIADITPPDLETKIAILHKKAEAVKMDLPDDVAIFMAQKIKSNIRQLEGSLVRLQALSSLRGDAIDQALAQEAIKHIIEDEPIVTLEMIQRVVANHYNLKVSDLNKKASGEKSKSPSKESKPKQKPRKRDEIVFPRYIAMYLCRKLTGASFPDIAEGFGGFDHSTVQYGVKKIQKLYDEKKDNIHIVIDRLIASCQ